MFYLIYGNYPYFINEKAKGLASKILNGEINDLNYLSLDYPDIKFVDLLSELSFLPFGCDKKVILLKNAEDILKLDKKQKEEFFATLDANSELVNLIVPLYTSKVTATFFDKLENKKLVAFKELTDDEWIRYIISKVEGKNSTITKLAAQELKKRCADDSYKLANCIEILCNYTKTIDIPAVKLLVQEPLEENSFNLLNALISGDTEQALKIYNDLLIKNNEPLMLMAVMASQLKFLNEVYYLSHEKRYSNDQIASELNTSSGRIYYTLKNLKSLNSEIIEKALDDLYILSKKIMLSEIDDKLGLELFIINFGK